MATITYYDWRAVRDNTRTLEVVYTRREFDTFTQGWHVRRADNKRLLGWVISPKEARANSWEAYAAPDAFRGDDINDEGYLLDEVPDDLTKRGSDWNTMTAANRLEVTEVLLNQLARERATALGFGRHPRVLQRHADRPKLREWYKAGMPGAYPINA